MATETLNDKFRTEKFLPYASNLLNNCVQLFK